MRVLYLSTDLQRGGYPLRLVRTVEAIRAYGVYPVVGCLACRGPLNDTLDEAGIANFHCDAAGRFDVRCLRRLAIQVRRFNPDILHSGLFHANVAARLVGRLDRSRPVITSTATIEIERRWHVWGEALSAPISDLHVVNSRSVAEHVLQDWGAPPAKVVVVPNGLDLAKIDAAPPAPRSALGLSEKTHVIVWAGRMDPIKDLVTFLDVVDSLRRRRWVQGLLVGEGPLRASVERTVRERGLEDYVLLLGWRTDVVSILKASNVLLFPSLSEGSPNVVLEAMACGCPVVTSDIPPCRDLITPGVSGEMCPVGDVHAFTAAISRILDDASRAAAYAAAARIHAECHHRIQDVAHQLAGLYQRLWCERSSGQEQEA